MKSNLLLVLLFSAFGFTASAQLANWTNLNATGFPTDISPQINGFCRITQLKFHATDPNKFYAVTAEGGLFTSSDAGSNWTVAPGMDVKTAACASVCVDRTNDQIIYLGTGDPNYYSNGSGIYKSTDGGATFTASSLTNCLVVQIYQHPTVAGTFIAATNKGIYKSTDNGTNWTASTATNIPFADMQQNTAANSLILYACTNENSPRYYRSTDFGSNWTQITSGIVAPSVNIQSGSRIAVTPADPNVVYFSEVGGGGMIFKSTDGGLNFTLQKNQGAPYLTFYDDDSASSGQGNYNNTLCVDRNDPTKVWMQSQNTWYSSNSGVTWTMLSRWSTIIHTDHHHLLQSPYDASKLYSCNDGGVWLSTDGGASWTTKSNGLYAYEVASFAGKSSHTDPYLVSIGTQDNGTLYRTANKWYTTIGGDDYDRREFDYLPNGGYWYNLDDNKRTKAPNAGTNTYGIPTTTVQAMGFNRANVELAFMGNQDIYRSTNLSAATPAWTQISSFNKTIKAVHSCIADPDRLYVITSDQLIYVSTNATAASPTFTSYNLPTASNTIASITAICNNADIVYIAINSKVYRSDDGGHTWANADPNGDLPVVNHRRILSEEYGGTEGLVFIATNNAVYYRKSASTSWTNYSTNLPSRRSPTDFSIFDDGTNRARIRYASYGRAVWETDFNNLRVAAVSFVADHTNDLCLTNGVVKFTDLSIGGPTAWSWSFPGGSPASSTVQNPTVTYSTPGTYDVTLTITTGSGMYTVTQTNYISVPTVNAGGTYSVGTGGDYATLTAAVNYWNSNCINGPVEFNLISANYPSETFPITINANGPQSSLRIKPTGTTTISGSSASALIVLNGVDRVTIDGSVGSTANTVCPLSSASRDLTITNNNTGTSSAVIWIQSSGSNGATDNTVKNCNLTGNANTTTLFGLGSGSNSIGTSSFGTGNHNNTFVNNKVQKTQYGIYSGGQSVTNKNTGTIINQNLLNSASPNNILRTGILVNFEDNILISGNFIGNTNVQNNTGSLGIACGGEASGSFTNFSGNEVTGATITYNVIDNIVRSQSFGSATGIFIASVTSTTGSGPNVIANNMISRILAPTAVAGNYVSGITIGGGRNSNTKLFYNSINLTGTQSNTIQTYGVMIGSAESYPIVEMRNNLVINQSSSTNRNYVIGLGWGSLYPRLFLDYNDFFAGVGNFAVVGGLANSPAGDRTTFAAWKTETGTDNHSKNVLPEFISASNLHLNTTGANNLANLIGFGIPVSVNTDIDCETRYTKPDMGADENCIAPTVPTISASVNPVCIGGNTILSITSGDLNKATDWKWYTGSCGGALAGTGTSITVSPGSTTTYYVRGEGDCVTPGSCGSITVTVNAPSTTITGPAAVCYNGSVLLDAGSGFAAYTWSNAGGNGQTATFSNITTATTFFVTVTDGNNCTATASKPVTVNPLPTPSITGTTTICAGQNTVLTGNGGASYVWSTGENTTSITVNPTMTSSYTVTASSANACTATASTTVTVNSLPVMTCPASFSVGINDPAFSLSGGMPSGGTYSGPGVNAGMFNPAAAGAGMHTIVYSFTDGNTCTNTCSFVITVNPPACPIFTGAPANVSITNSTCNISCIASGGSITAPGGSPCPAGSTLQYQVNNGAWSSTLPMYDQDGPAQTIKTRCSCDVDNLINSAESSPVTTMPANCGANLSLSKTVDDATPDPLQQITYTILVNNAGPCQASNVEVTDVVPAGLQYVNGSMTGPGTYVNNAPSTTGLKWQNVVIASGGSVTLTFKVDVLVGTGSMITNFAQVTASAEPDPNSTPNNGNIGEDDGDTEAITVGSNCPFFSGAPANVSITNSACNSNCIAAGGLITAPAGTPCPSGSSIQYQVNNGSWSSTLPMYDQDGPAQTIKTRCSCDVDNNIVSAASNPVTTIPANCTDNTLPMITCPANVVTANTSGQCNAIVSYTTPVGTDNCPGVTTVQTGGLASGALFPVGVTTNTFRATDASANSATCNFTVTVNDTQLPGITCPGNMVTTNTANLCSATVTYTAPVGTDNCSSPNTQQTGGLASGASFPVGITTNTFKVTDASNNTATCAFTVTVNDTQLPSITCPANMVTSNTVNLCSATVTYTAPVGTDNCSSPNTQQTGGLASGASFPVGTTTNTFKVTDGSNNTATCAFTVTVNDTQLPGINCPVNIAVGNTIGQCGATVTYTTPVGTDNCSSPSTQQTGGLASGASFPVGITTNTFKVTDASNNTATCAFTVTVTDTQLPAISCPNNISVGNTLNLCGATVTYTTPVGTDNCSGPTTLQTGGLASGALYPIGSTTNTFKVTDASSNSATCAFTVTVGDTQLPAISCPANILVNNTVNLCSAVVTYTTPVGTDNCAGPTTLQTAGLASGSSFPVGVTTNVFRVTDVAANTATCGFTVTVKDNQAPTIVCPANQNILANASCSGSVGSWNPSSVSDNCGAATVTQSPAPATPLLGHNASALVTLTATDGGGNTGSCSFTVTLKDQTPPVVKCKIATVNLGANGTVTVPPASIDNGSTDNCNFSLQVIPATFNCSNIGMNTVTLRATDDGGNTATCTVKVTVKDLSGPTALCKNPTIFLNSLGQATLTTADVNNGSTDNCGIGTMSIDKALFNCSEIVGRQPVTLSLTDQNGNSSSCLSYVAVRDAIAPTAICEDVTVQLGSNGKATVYGASLAASSTDNCSVWSYSPIAKVYTAANLGDNLLSITVKDWSGNAATCVSVVTVEPFNGPQQSQGDSNTDRNDEPDNFAFNVYPNPTTGDAAVAFELKSAQPVLIRVFDLQGRMILLREDLGLEGENTLGLRLEGAAPGVYIVDFQSGDLKVQRRLVLQQ